MHDKYAASYLLVIIPFEASVMTVFLLVISVIELTTVICGCRGPMW